MGQLRTKIKIEVYITTEISVNPLSVKTGKELIFLVLNTFNN
jgi:hypothetical protein